MYLSATLTGYVARQFALAVLAMVLIMATVIFLVDSVELLRRASSKPDATFAIVIGMSLLKLPNMIEQSLGFAVLFGGMFCLVKLTRHHELVVVRARRVFRCGSFCCRLWRWQLP